MIMLEFQDAKFQARFTNIIKDAKNPRPVLMAAGRAVGSELKTHFTRKDRTQPNKLSQRRSKFWDQVMRSVNKPAIENSNTVSVSISDPRFAQKVFGGSIKAKAAAALTIPVEERAYGRTAHTFQQETGLKLFLLKVGGTKANHFENAVLAVAENGHITVEYLLTKEVNQKADPDALPQKSLLEQAIITASQRALDKQIAGEKAPE